MGRPKRERGIRALTLEVCRAPHLWLRPTRRAHEKRVVRSIVQVSSFGAATSARKFSCRSGMQAERRSGKLSAGPKRRRLPDKLSGQLLQGVEGPKPA